MRTEKTNRLPKNGVKIGYRNVSTSYEKIISAHTYWYNDSHGLLFDLKRGKELLDAEKACLLTLDAEKTCL